MRLQLSFLVTVIFFSVCLAQNAKYTCGDITDSPCLCEDLGNKKYNFKCYKVPSKIIATYLSCDKSEPDDESCNDITETPGQNKIEAFHEFAITPAVIGNPGEMEEIQDDVLAGRSASVIRIATPSPYDYMVKISKNAFSSSANVTEKLVIYDANLVNFDWTFLEQFVNLKTIHLQGIKEGIKEFASKLPRLDSVTALMMVSCVDASSVPRTSQLPGLTNLSLIDNNFSDAQIITDIFNQLAGAKLEYISLRRNLLTIYPVKLKEFDTLHSVDLSENNIAGLDSALSLQFTAPVKQVDLTNNKIRVISGKEVFAGDFSQAIVKLDGNMLELLDGKVFFDLTQTMMSGGKISVNSNNLKCDCSSVGWLIHDNYYLVSDHIVEGSCNYEGSTTATQFTALNPEDETFRNCPVTEFTTTTSSTTTTTITSTTVTESTTTTTPTTTTPSTQPPPNTTTTSEPTTSTMPPDDTYQEQLAALFGLFGGLFLIIIIGFAILFSQLNKAKKVVAGSGTKRKDSIESGPKPQAKNQQLIGGYSSQQPQQMTTFTQPQQQSNVLPRVTMPPAQSAQTNGNTASINGQQQPRGLRRSDYY